MRAPATLGDRRFTVSWIVWTASDDQPILLGDCGRQYRLWEVHISAIFRAVVYKERSSTRTNLSVEGCSWPQFVCLFSHPFNI